MKRHNSSCERAAKVLRLISTFFLASLSAVAAPQQPDVINGKLETRPLAGPLAQEFHKLEASSTSPLWLVYTFPAIPGQGTMCGSLENNNSNSRHNNIVRLEGPENLLVLFRLENRALDRVRVSSLDCQFDSGGLPFILLTGVQPAQSVDLLLELVHTCTQTSRKAHFDSLITAIALHRDPAADRALESMLALSQPESLREKALFWLANSRGRSGFEAVRRVLQTDPSDQVRDKATFALTVSKEAGAIPTLVEAARKDKSTKVRSQALFWLAQKAGLQESPVILEAARQDPDAHVRRQAVFALKQIPQGDGIPLLIQLARTSTDTEVRKQAVFWLGQSHDPRATSFFEEVLK
jgi:HEAT repeat protein